MKRRNQNKWGKNVLQNVISNNETVVVEWEDARNQQVWSIMVIDADGRKLYWPKLNLTDVSCVILKPEGNAELQ